MRQKWTKELVLSRIKQVKADEGHIHMSYLQKNHGKLRGAIERLFNSFVEAIEEAGFDPVAENGDSGSGFRGKTHSAKTKHFIRLWGSDIKNNLNECKTMILELIKEVR